MLCVKSHVVLSKTASKLQLLQSTKAQIIFVESDIVLTVHRD